MNFILVRANYIQTHVHDKARTHSNQQQQQQTNKYEICTRAFIIYYAKTAKR
jgi:hypothetical protein